MCKLKSDMKIGREGELRIMIEVRQIAKYKKDITTVQLHREKERKRKE